VRWEARATRRFERDCLPNVDAVIAISRLDAEAFFDLAGIDSVVVPPWLEPRIPRVEVTTAPALIYVGTPDWLPNAYGLDWFCRKVWPLVREQMPETTLTIAGGGRPGAADGGDRMHPEWRVPGIKASGFVKDLEPLYCRALAFIAPVLGGSGVRMKLLEAFSAGLPAVTTSDGAAGLDVAHGRELLIADTACAFADNVVQLLRDADLREGLRRRGRAFLSANHSRAGSRAQLARALGVSLQAEAPRIAMAGS
jgi:glycosyltransferase involved in cell wall biosynthesis